MQAIDNYGGRDSNLQSGEERRLLSDLMLCS